jgi:hypothetical protein
MTQLVSFQYVTEAVYSTIIPSLIPGMTKEKMSSQSQLLVSASSGVAAGMCLVFRPTFTSFLVRVIHLTFQHVIHDIGVISAICSHPPDTVLTRINMAAKSGKIHDIKPLTFD